ncbi:Crp/Fnr family transcriptional regulator [Komagataeibacter swingsii]|uniref:Helix-turn-helix domain-containing protein n=1 Tax=Komagataeibacter swingsii TaxID=215220 RepID=A0A850NVA0_9PROT|nr:helix-turn-helix domain-containing protein [Komagataeibacter swingsii]AHI27060.1 transcriptional regulator, Crp/Fnr family [Komagataeibacter xylinus E25]NVN36345.1 helix-turn-helix domain-containing protein [Komagataeibacter swingsii]RFP00004.1 transcriptional regulator [Komagataeibacter xylinus]RFP01020.1 transcriptional regulator [Komagataeibacter xylinus]
MSDMPSCQFESRPRRIVIGAGGTQADFCTTCSVRPTSVCSVIGPDDISRLSEAAVETIIPPGRGFIEEGAPATDFFNVTSGTVKLFKALPDGRRQITGFASPGHFLGLAVSDSYAFGAEAVDTVRVCRFSRDKMADLLDDFPKLERRLLEEASNELVAAQNQMLLLGRKTARERVASFLLDQMHASQMPGQESSGGRLHLPMTRGDIADYLGLTIETVSRTLSWMRSQGMIEVGKGYAITILSVPKLDVLAAGNT